MSDTTLHRSSGNVFLDLGFDPHKAAMLEEKSALADEIAKTVAKRRLTLQKASLLCKAETVFFSKVLRGNIEIASIELLAGWLHALGRTIEFRVRQ